MKKITPEYRVALTINIINAFRESLESRKNVYHGTMIPNITSITDALTFSDEMLEKQLLFIPENILPSEEMVEGIKKAWDGTL